METTDFLPANVAFLTAKKCKAEMAPFTGFGWGWGEPRTGTLAKIDFLFTGNALGAFQTLVLSPLGLTCYASYHENMKIWIDAEFRQRWLL